MRTYIESKAVERRLRQMHNRPTKYEIVLSDGTTSYLLAYSARKTRASLWQTALEEGQRIIDVTGISDKDEIVFDRWNRGGIEIGPTWRVRFARTERTAVLEGQEASIAA